ncbi:hypothetical protein ACFV29_32575 [Streptomyces sp. NPDC059690]|uniref:hypothetical protein n=1 Tax=Streptomyces sp. NPDC059690 TaxID=3346907 RepID=UPI0036831C52
MRRGNPHNNDADVEIVEGSEDERRFVALNRRDGRPRPRRLPRPGPARHHP